ncbi:hypothetical protein CLFE_045820 (plasmid) [Clostridium felsineum DSM 794]|nr:hypothetical protein CLFE_045820 [Clostridium felsineum DSM 794]
MIPRVKLSDLLLEVSKQTGFDKNFLHASTCYAAKGEEKTILMASLMAIGTNIGLSKCQIPLLKYHIAKWSIQYSDDYMTML